MFKSYVKLKDKNIKAFDKIIKNEQTSLEKGTGLAVNGWVG
jgi:hypothetical protein